MSDENCKGLIGGGMFVDPIPMAGAQNIMARDIADAIRART